MTTMTAVGILLSISLLLPYSASSEEESTGFDLDGIEEKIGGLLPTGMHAFGAIVAIKIKKILLFMTLLLGTALTTKLFSGLFPFFGYGYGPGGYGGHSCPFSKPIFIKEVEYEKSQHYNKDYENYERPQYEEQYQRSLQKEHPYLQELVFMVEKSFRIMQHLDREQQQQQETSFGTS